jgi:hypothetical protein
MRIGIIGAGNVGTTLGRGWLGRGHEVVFGLRDLGAERLAKLRAAAGEGARGADPAGAAAGAEVVVVATPWGAARAAIDGAGDLAGKVLLDCTNPLRGDLGGLELGLATSGGEQLAGWAPEARVVKIFNTTGVETMADPRYPDGAAAMFYCGDDADAKRTAASLAADLGFEPIDAGPLSRARLLEPLALLWIRLAIEGGSRGLAFRLMRR